VLRSLGRTFVVLLCLMSFAGCEWFVFQLSTPEPVYLGANPLLRETGDNSFIDSIRTVEGHYTYRLQEETVSQGRNSTFSMSGDETLERDIHYQIDDAMQEGPNRFVSDVRVRVTVETGFPIGNVLFLMIANMITGGESGEVGQYTEESVHVTGTVRAIRAGNEE
jgi:hypothetical protein